MRGSGRTTKRLWRWRSNPLRRADDTIEAWIILAMWAVLAVGGGVAGLLTAHAAAEGFAHQRAERHSARAVLLSAVPCGCARGQGPREPGSGEGPLDGP